MAWLARLTAHLFPTLGPTVSWCWLHMGHAGSALHEVSRSKASRLVKMQLCRKLVVSTGMPRDLSTVSQCHIDSSFISTSLTFQVGQLMSSTDKVWGPEYRLCVRLCVCSQFQDDVQLTQIQGS